MYAHIRQKESKVSNVTVCKIWPEPAVRNEGAQIQEYPKSRVCSGNGESTKDAESADSQSLTESNSRGRAKLSRLCDWKQLPRILLNEKSKTQNT